MSINPTQCKNLKFFECRKTKLMQKAEIECKNLKLNWLTGKSRIKNSQMANQIFCFQNKEHFLDGAIHGAIFTSLRDTRAFLLLNHLEFFFINQHGEIFSWILLTGNQMIFFSCNLEEISTRKFFSKTTKFTRPTGSCNFVSLWKNLLVLIYSKLHSKSFDYLYKFVTLAEVWSCLNNTKTTETT